MAITRLAIPKGITPPKVVNVPDQWSSAWFRNFIKIWLQNQANQLTAGSALFTLGSDGSLTVNGNEGTAGQVLTSQGTGQPANWSNTLTFASGAGFSINAAANNHGLVVTGGNNASGNSYAAVVFSGTGTTGSQSGLYVAGGTNNSDAALTVANGANNETFLQILGNGAISGRGPQAAALVDMTPDEATFTGTLTGVSSGGTGTVSFRKIGTMAVLMFNFSGVSNTTAMTMTGLPSYAQPAIQQNVTCNILNGGNQILGVAAVIPGSGTITFSANILVGSQVQFSSTAFTASGNKGGNSTCIIYSLL